MANYAKTNVGNEARVEYGLTDLGRQMIPVMDSLADFGDDYKTIVS